jgi:hypothetical protein
MDGAGRVPDDSIHKIETFLICGANRPTIMTTRYSNSPPRVLPADDDVPLRPEPSPLASAQAKRAHRQQEIQRKGIN